MENHRWFCCWGNKCPVEKKIAGWNIMINKLYESFLLGKKDKESKFNYLLEIQKL